MSSFNRVILMGNITRDIELKHTQGGTARAKFGLAVNEAYTFDGEKRERTTFVDITAWATTAETIGKYLGKGDAIFIEGRLEFSEWADKATGAKRTALGVVCERFQFMGGKKAEAAASDDTVAF